MTEDKDGVAPAPEQPQEVEASDESASQNDASATTEEYTPAGALDETNGGPLGCCLGTMTGLLLSLSLAVLSRLFIDPLGALFQANYGLIGLLVRVLMVLAACALALAFGRIGWRLGKRFFREYDPPVLKERRHRVRASSAKQRI